MISDRVLHAIQVGLVEGFGRGVEDFIGTPEERAFAAGYLSNRARFNPPENYLGEYFEILDMERSFSRSAKLFGPILKISPAVMGQVSTPPFSPSEQGALMCVDPNFNPAAQP